MLHIDNDRIYRFCRLAAGMAAILGKIDECGNSKRGILYRYLAQIEYTIVEVDTKILDIARRFIDLGILKQNSLDDCRHIAAAIVSKCDAIVSWNFKHIVNHKTINGVRIITTREGYPNLLIYAPPMLTGDDDEDDA